MKFNLAPVPVPDLSGRVVLVTGAGRGIGAETVRQLVAHGARVFAGVHPKDEVEPMPDAATVVRLDVTDQAMTDAVIAQVSAEAGRLDVLVNNAGVISPIKPLDQIAADELMPALSVNIAGLHRVTMAALPMLTAAKGSIVNAGTGAATTPMEGWTAYCSSKAGMRMLTQMYVLELGARGIHSFFLGIPPTDTPMQGAIRQAGLNPISQIPQADLVPTAVPASCLAWLCSAEAKPAARQEVGDCLLDVRQERFTAMMSLPT